MDGAQIGAAFHRTLCADHSDRAAFCGRDSRFRAGLHDTNDRYRRQRFFQCGECHSRGGVAGDDDEFDIVAHERARGLHGVTLDGVRAFGAVRKPRRIPKVHKRLVRQRAHECAHHGQAAHTGIENADGTRVHGSFVAK
jgi:hypothetical protein